MRHESGDVSSEVSCKSGEHTGEYREWGWCFSEEGRHYFMRYLHSLFSARPYLPFEDFIQDAYVRALNYLHERSAPHNPRSWMKRVLQHIGFDYVASHRGREKREKVYAVRRQGTEDTCGVHAHGLEERLNDDRLSHNSVVLCAITRLSPSQRRMLQEFYGEGKSLDTLSDEYGITPRSVIEALSRARATLRKELSEYGGSV